MAVVRNLMVRAGADFSNASKKMQAFQKELNGFQSKISNSMKAIGAALAMAGASLGLASATKSAMEYESAVLQINRTMQTSAKIFQDWAKQNASSYGMAQVEAMKYGGIFSNLISGFAKDTKEVQAYTSDLLKAGAITAAATGRTIEDTMDRIRSGMLGSTEAIEDLGINVNIAMIESTNAFKRFANDKSWAQLDFQTQQQIRLYAILEQASQKYGDTVANSTAAKQAMFVASLKNVQLALGQAFLPIYNIVLPVLTRFANALSTAMNYVAQFTQALFGKASTKAIDNQAKSINAEAAAVDGLGNSIKSTAKAAKGMIAGFDELNQFSSSQGGASGADAESLNTASAVGGLPALDAGGFAESTIEVSAKVQAMVDRVKAAYQEMSDFIKTHSDLIIAALAGVGTAFTIAFGVAKWGTIVSTLQKFGAAIVALFSPAILAIGLVVAAIGAVVAAIVYFYRTNEQFKGFVDGIFEAIGKVAKWLWNDVLVPFAKWIIANIPNALNAIGSVISSLWNNIIVPFGNFLANTFKLIWDNLSTTINWLWQNVLVPLGAFLLTFWQTILVPLAAIITDVLAVAFDYVANVAKSFWENVLVPLGSALSEMLKPAIEAVSAVFTFLWNNVLVPFGTFLSGKLLPIWQSLIKILSNLWENVLKPVANFVKGIFLSAFDNTFKTIGGIIDGVKKVFIGLMNFITGVFTGDWKKAWDGVKDIFKGVFDSLYSIIKLPLNLIIDGINKLIGGLNSISIDIPEWVPGFGGETFGISIPKIPKLARGGVVNGSTNFGNYIAGEAGSELVMPLENTSFISEIANAIGMAVSNAMQINQNGQQETILSIDGTAFARITAPLYQRENQRIGTNMIKLGGV